MTDIRMDLVTGEIDFEYGVSLHQTKLEALAQRLKIRLQLRKGEWLLDTATGIPFLQMTQLKGDKTFADSFYRTYILETEGVIKLISYSSEITKDRKLAIQFRVQGESGVVDSIDIGGVNVL